MYVIGLVLLVLSSVNGALAFKEDDVRSVRLNAILVAVIFAVLVAMRSAEA